MMRKIKTLYSRTLLLRAMACGLILTVLLNLAGFSAQCAALEENIVRLHVIANSNDEADQAVKLRVRDAVLREAEQWYGDAEDFDTAVTALCTHLESLEAAANSVLKAENLPYCAKCGNLRNVLSDPHLRELQAARRALPHTAHFARQGRGQKLVVRRISGAVHARCKRPIQPA